MSTPDDIIKEVCSYAGITEDNLSMPRRFGCLVAWRRICAYALRKKLNLSYQKIATILGYAKHENAMFHINKMQKWLDEPQFAPRDEVIACRNIINNLKK